MNINSLGPNSYAISCTSTTNVSEILEGLKTIANYKNEDTTLKHGWKFIGASNNYSLTYNLGVKTFDIVIFESDCNYGRKKYIVFCADIVKNTIEIMSTNGWDYNTGWFNQPVYSLSSISKFYGASLVGSIEHPIHLPFDRFEFIVFIHPKWFATTIRNYSSLSYTYFIKYDPTVYDDIKVLGLSGVFEAFNNFNPAHNSVLLNTALSLGNFYTLYMGTTASNMSAAAVDEVLFNNRSSIELSGLGQDLNISYVYSTNVNSRGLIIGGINELKDNKPQIKMLELIRTDDYNVVTLKNVKFTNICKVHGLKATKFYDKMLASVNVPCNSDDYSLNNYKSSKKHYNIPSCVSSVRSLGGPSYDTNEVGFLLPA